MKMESSLDCAVSSLLCAEDNSTIFYDGDYDNIGVDYGIVDDFEDRRYIGNSSTNDENQRFYGGEALTGLPMQSKECLDLMFKTECEHLPACDYLKRLKNGDSDLGARQEVVDWIQKVHAHFSFGPLCLYLSINYLDRFISAYELPGKAWMMQLLAVACLSLAAKMEETEVPQCIDLQVGESKFIFEAKTVQRMELLVLSTLKWRMKAVTPFSFIDYFLKEINGDQINSRLLITRAILLVLSTLRGIDFLEFRPSEIAAAAAISAAGKTQSLDAENAISALIQQVEKDRVMKCVELMPELSSLSGFVKGPNRSVLSVPQSPIGVLDAACLSYKTDDPAVGSCANSSHSSPVAKRRKLVDL